MAKMTTWNPWQWPVQGGIKEGEFASSTHAMLAAGPPRLAEVDSGDIGESVFPIGMIQNFSWGQNKAIARIHEVGSKRTYAVTGHAMGGLSLGSVYFSGPSLLRKMWGVWEDFDGQSLWDKGAEMMANSQLRPSALDLPYIPPGYENYLYNLASDFFDRSVGLMLLVNTNLQRSLIATYFEDILVPSHNMSFDGASVVLPENVTMDYERVVPCRANYIPLQREIQDLPF